jgi:hypothetical protein
LDISQGICVALEGKFSEVLLNKNNWSLGKLIANAFEIPLLPPTITMFLLMNSSTELSCNCS